MRQILVILLAFAFIGHIYPLDFQEGDSFVVTYYNSGRGKVRDLHASVYIPDLDIYERSERFYISGQDSAKSVVPIYDDINEGYYPVIVTLENDDGVYERTHTWVRFN
ncbi:MAG: hypothetical protein NDI94_00685 [Candidatus Woesearchaeota archaeon]|nr:hypothetical protein [Candidatus Woesearchaeota archaeon]